MSKECIKYPYQFLPCQLPTGEKKLVNNSPFDFRNEKEIGKSINVEDLQLKYGSGYDHKFYIKQNIPQKITICSKLFSPASGIVINVFTDQPGIQFFTANAFKGLDTGRTGKPIVFRSAFCLETQHFLMHKIIQIFLQQFYCPVKYLQRKRIINFL